MKVNHIFLGVLLVLFTVNCNNKKTTQTNSEEQFSTELTPQEIKNAKLTPEILMKFGRVSEMQLSPDGKTVIYNVTRYNVKTNKSHTWIFKVAAEGGDTINLTRNFPSCSNPRFISNDKIAFLCSQSGSSQIWTMGINGDNKTRVTSDSTDINGFEFSGNGKMVFYLKDVKTDSTTHDKYPDLNLTKAMIIDDLMYRHWDSWTDYARSHIFVASFDGNKTGTATDILKDEPYDSPLSPYFDISEISWNADGSKLAYSCKKLNGREYAVSTNSDIYVYTVSDKSTVNITEGLPGYDRYPVFSPDGKKIAFQSMATPGYESDKERLFVYNFDTKTNTYLTRNFDQDASSFSWATNNNLFFISGINATYQVYEINTDNDSIKPITHGRHDYKSVIYSNGNLVGTKTSMTMAAEIFKIDTASGVEKQLTFTNKNIYDAIKFGSVQERWVTTTDNKKMLVWLILPPDFDSTKTYPALLYCQGGPQSAVSQFFSYRWNFMLMAANNYVIIAPNRRGLPTFGEEWNAQISGDYGGQNIKDYLTATDVLKKEPFIDENRLGAVGASYGGYSVFFLAGCHQNRFKAFVSHCGIYNLESQYASTEEIFFVNHDLGGAPWQTPKPISYTKFSPHLYVDKWNTPILIITGGNDFRIPYTQSLEAFGAAQLRGVPSKLLYFPDESHWVSKPQNSILWQREFYSWLDKWLKH